MSNRIAFLLLAFTFILSSGCAHSGKRTIMEIDESRNIERSEIQEALNNPSETTIPIRKDDTVTIITNEPVKLPSGHFYRLKVYVTKVDASNIEGEVLDRSASELIKINFSDIDEIRFWEQKTIKAPLPGQAVRKSINLTLLILAVLLAL